jgi:urease accessory protein
VTDSLRLARLLRLASPTLPIGAFGYSQGLEWAVESGSVRDEAGTLHWIEHLLRAPLARFELPILLRMFSAWAEHDDEALTRLNEEFFAARETMELRAETLHMGQALSKALRAAGDVSPERLGKLDKLGKITYPAAFACAVADWNVLAQDGLTAYAFAWLENQVMAAIKLVPLGQSAGQRLLAACSGRLPEVMAAAQNCTEEDFSSFAPMLAIASSQHETQYTRLFRS